MNKVQSLIVLPDIHYPKQDKTSMRAVELFMEDNNPWDYLIYSGDQLDLETISHWMKDKHLKIEGKRLKRDYDGFQRDILNVHERIVGPKCKKVFMLGNHEDWVQDAINYNPQNEGFYEIENNLKLDNYEIVPLNKVYQIGKLRIIHGIYTNKYNAHKTVDEFGRSVLYAHTHSIQSYTKSTPQDVRDFHSACAIGCLCDTNPDYMEGRPNAWVHGFAVVYLMPDRSYNFYQVTIVNGKFAWNGKIYDGNN